MFVVEWLLRELFPLPARLSSCYNSQSSTVFMPFFMKITKSVCVHSSIMVWRRITRRYYETHLCYSLLLLCFHVCVMHLCKSNSSLFYSSEIQYHVYQHVCILIIAVCIISLRITGTHHSFFVLQWSSVTVSM